MVQLIDWKNNYKDNLTESNITQNLDKLNEIAARRPVEDAGIIGVGKCWPGHTFEPNNRIPWIRLWNYLQKMRFIHGRIY